MHSTFRGICSNDENDPIRKCLEPMLKGLAEAYSDIRKQQKGKRKEFFGLRDFYRYRFRLAAINYVHICIHYLFFCSLIKMLYYLVKNKPGSQRPYLNRSELKHAVLRNFGGSGVDPLEIFEKCLKSEFIIQKVSSRPN